MANRFWVGGTGTWDTTTTTNWSATTGGAGGASVPTSADSVVIDTLSGTGTITCTAGVCLDLTVTATQAIILGAASSTLSVFGNLTFPSGGSFSVISSSTITFASTTTGKTITTNGKSLGGIIFNGVGGGWTLGSALVSGATLTLTNGTLDTSSTSNYSFSASNVQLNAGTKTFNLNASTVTFSGNVNFLTNATGFTLNTGTSTLVLTGTFQPNTYTYYNVTFLSQTVDGLRNIVLTTNLNVSNVITLGATNTAVRRIYVASDVIGTQRTITATTVASMNDVDFRDIAFSSAQTGTRLGDCGGNSNITFPVTKTVYWNLAGSQNWSAIGWATSSGGTPAVNNFPLAQDTAVIDNTSAGSTITINATWNIGTFDASLRTSALTTTFSAAPNCYLNWITGTGITYSSTGALTFAGRTTQQLTSAGVSFTNGITINTTTSGSVQLQDAFTTASTQTVTLTQGTLNLNNFNLTCGLFNFNNTNTKSIAFGTGQMYISASNAGVFGGQVTGLTVTGTPTVNFTYSGSTGTRNLSPNSTAFGPESVAFNLNILSGSDTVSISYAAKSVNFTGFSGTWSNTNNTLVLYGDLTLSSGMTVGAGANAVTFTSTVNTQKITSAGKTMDFPININGNQIAQLQDALTMGSTRTLTLTSGTLDTNNYNVTTGLFTYSNTNTKAILMGSSTWSLTGTGTVWNANATGTTLTRGTSQINTTSTSTKTFAGASQTYYNLANTGAGALTISGNNTYNNLSALGGCPLTITSGSTQSANTFTFQGASSITIAPSSTTNYTLTKLGGGIVDMQNVSISRCTASPSTGTWYAGASTDGGNNTGIRFVSAPKFQQMF